jgi:hypothetical protein
VIALRPEQVIGGENLAHRVLCWCRRVRPKDTWRKMTRRKGEITGLMMSGSAFPMWPLPMHSVTLRGRAHDERTNNG